MKTTFLKTIKSMPHKIAAIPRAEQAKLILLAVLVVSGVILGYFTGTFVDTVRPSVKPIAVPNAAGRFAPAAYPYAILVSEAEGEHHGAIYNADGLSAAWDATSLALSEAMGTAGKAISVREEEFRAAVGDAGIVFAYRIPIPLDVLLNWLNVKDAIKFDTAADIICLSASGDFSNSEENYTLYYRADDGRFFKRDGVSAIRGHEGALSAVDLPAVYFAFENPEYKLTNAYTILPDTVPQLNQLNVKIPQMLQPRVREILSALEMNPYNSADYREGNAAVYAESNTTLKIYDYGLIEYNTKSEGYIALSDAESIDLAYGMLTEITQSDELQLTACENNGSRYEMKFEYIRNGIMVLPGAAATVLVDGGRVRSLTVTLREYETTQETGGLLPTRQALIAAGKELNSIEVVYAEQASTATPVWVSKNDEGTG